MVEHINRDTVGSRLRRLDDEYGVDYHEDVTVTVDPAAFDEEIRMSRDGYIGSSYVWIVRTPGQTAALSESMPDDSRDEDDRVLMILGRGGHAWGL